MASSESHTFELTESQRRFLWLLAERAATIGAKQDQDGYVYGIEEEIRAMQKIDPRLAADCARVLGDVDEIEELTRVRPRP